MADNKAESKTQVFYDAPPTRPAPTIQTGILAWMRDNLFRSWSDVILTLLSLAIVYYAVTGFFNWAIGDANWWAITFNFRQFMVGRYETALEWRVVVATLFTVFVLGMAVAIWIRQIARLAALTLGMLLLVVFLLPLIVYAAVPKPPVYMTVGTSFTVGTAAQNVRPEVAFLGRANEEVTARLTVIPDDSTLAQLHGFMESTTSALLNAARRRLNDLARQQELEDILARHDASDVPLLTRNQAQLLRNELQRLRVPDIVVEQVKLNTASVEVVILDGTTLEAIGKPVVLNTPDDVLRVTLPKDGWYVIRKVGVNAEDTASIIQVTGIDPIQRLSVSQGSAGFVNTYVRMTDYYRVEIPLPEREGRPLPFFVINEHQYRGSHDFGTYLRLYLAPFLQQHNTNLAILVVLSVLGFWAARLIERFRDKRTAARLTSILMVVVPVLIWVMVTGFSIPEVLNMMLVLGAVALLAFINAAAAKFGRSITSIALLAVGVAVTTAMPFILFAPHYGFGILPVFNLIIVLPAIAFWFIGSDSYGVDDAAATNRALLLSGLVWLALLLVPYVLVNVAGLDPKASYPDWFLRLSDQRNWGGLLLTIMLTIFGIVASFPIGVLLALGRRSNLPAVKYGCVAFIELIRGSPFVTVLFLGQLMIPLISPSLAEVPAATRALVATVIFSAAYLAENVRGGLQSLPYGQTEAGRALGLSGWQVTYYITLPQALRAVIPALVGQFISLFKDTSLVAIVGLIDLTGLVGVIVVQAEFPNTRSEGLLFITLIYFVFSYVMSYISRLLEASGSGSVRRI